MCNLFVDNHLKSDVKSIPRMSKTELLQEAEYFKPTCYLTDGAKSHTLEFLELKCTNFNFQTSEVLI